MGSRQNARTDKAGDLPAAFIERLGLLVPPERFDAVLGTFSAGRPLCVRANTLRRDAAAVAAELLALTGVQPEPLAGFTGVWLLPSATREVVTASNLFNEGALYVQNPSSLVPPLLLAPEPGMEVLDLAAAPGGKSIHLAELMQDRGRLACVEAVRGRFFRLRANLERCGVTIAETYLKDGRRVGRQVPARFDRVLLDAPCSSEARMRVGRPDTLRHWSPRKIRECARKQRGLLLSALDAVKPGGRVVYCTCSLAPEENELVVEYVLDRCAGDVRVVPVDPGTFGVHGVPGVCSWMGNSVRDALSGVLRILPSGAFDGLVVCVLERGA